MTVLNYLYDVFETSDGGIIACGVSSRAVPGPDGIQRMWVLKLDSAGCDAPGCDPTVGIIQLSPISYPSSPITIYPNPSSDRVYIRFSESNKTPGKNRKIEIISILGVKVKEVEIPPISEYTLFVNDLASGVYLVNILEDGKLVHSGKVMVRR